MKVQDVGTWRHHDEQVEQDSQDDQDDQDDGQVQHRTPASSTNDGLSCARVGL